MSLVSRLVENSADDGLCPSCHMPFDTGKRRRLLDSCGHERCYSCLFQQGDCPVCITLTTRPELDQENLYASMKTLRCDRSPGPGLRTLRGPSSVDPDCLYGSVASVSLGRRITQANPPPGKRMTSSALPSPGPGARRNWIQRHNRRPQTVSVDKTTMSGETRKPCQVRQDNRVK